MPANGGSEEDAPVKLRYAAWRRDNQSDRRPQEEQAGEVTEFRIDRDNRAPRRLASREEWYMITVGSGVKM